MADIEQSEPTADSFRQLADLLALVKDAAACELRLAELRRKHHAVRLGEKKLAADRLAFEEQMAKANAEIEQRRKTAANIWQTAKAAEISIRNREVACTEREIELGLRSDPDNVAIQGSGFSRDRRPRAVRTDLHGAAFPADTTITRSESGPEAA